MKRINVIFLLTLILILGCEPTKDQRIKQITEMEKQLQQEKELLSAAKADSMLRLYSEFVAEFPKDTLCAEYLCRAGVVASNRGDCQQAIAFFDKAIMDFSDLGIAAECLLRKGYAYENCDHDVQKAKESYSRFIQDYPNHPYVKDAKMLLEMLSMPDEMELIRQFEQRENSVQNQKE